VTKTQLEQGTLGKDYTYTAQIVWREAATDKILAQSDTFGNVTRYTCDSKLCLCHL
jgi:hypothetical protein